MMYFLFVLSVIFVAYDGFCMFKARRQQNLVDVIFYGFLILFWAITFSK